MCTSRTRRRRAPRSVSRRPAGTTSPSAWNAGFATAGFCGTASDTPGSGLQTVEISIRRGTGNYYDGSSFSSAGELYLTAAGSTSWSYDFATSQFPVDGSYTIHVEGDGQRRKRRELIVTHLRLRRLGSHGPDPRLLGLHERERDRPDGLLPLRRRGRVHRERVRERSGFWPLWLCVPGARLRLERKPERRHLRLQLQRRRSQPGRAERRQRTEQRRPRLEHQLHRDTRRARPGDVGRLRRRLLRRKLVHELRRDQPVG